MAIDDCKNSWIVESNVYFPLLMMYLKSDMYGNASSGQVLEEPSWPWVIACG